LYRDLLEEIPEVDFVLTGEADYSFTQLLDNFSLGSRLKVRGLAQRHEGEITLEPPGPPVDLELLPVNDFSLWPVKEAIQKGWFKTGIPIEAGRGCPYSCYFCSTNNFFHRNYRMKSPLKLKKEIAFLFEEYGFSSFKFIHDLFTANRKDVTAIAEALDECEGPEVTWSCFARTDTVDRQLLETMWNSGCRNLFFGIETGSSRMQEIIGKGLNLDAVESVLSHAQELGFQLSISCITGYPEENWDDLEASLELLLRWSGIDNVSAILFHLEPEPGTKVFEKYRDRMRRDADLPKLYLNKMYPEREIAIVTQHPKLFPHYCFFDNDHLERIDIIPIVEFAKLLLRRLPGIGPLVLQTEPSVLDLIRRWKGRCIEDGLHVPKEMDFFAYATKQHVPYMRTLLGELRKNPRVTGAHHPFIEFWEGILDFESDTAPCEGEGGPNHAGDSWDVVRDKQKIPVITQRHALLTLDRDVTKCLESWQQSGIWKMPDNGPAHYLLFERKDGTGICRLPPLSAAVVNLCGVEHTLAQIHTILDAASIRKGNNHTVGILSNMDDVFRFLRDVAGVNIVLKDSA
jgi:radical SAM superfamily enzyme